jgi:ribosomal protein S6--L-glutamate ligase
MGLRVAGVDILQSDKGPLVLEVNSSPGLEGIERATQIDVAGMIVKDIDEQVAKANALVRKRKKEV